MKRLILLVLVSVFMFSCEDDRWKQELENIKTELANQKQLIEALQKNSTITSVEQGDGQYTIKFSNGQSITLSNRKTPIITIGDNGNWYIDGIDTGNPSQGNDGTNGDTPSIEIGGNGNWIINGNDTGIKAEGIDGSDAPYIKSIAIIYNAFYFYFSDGNNIIVPIKPTNNLLNTKNLFNPQRVEVINEYNFIRSEFIPINKGESLTASTNTTLWQTNCALYDINLNILEESKINIKDNSKTVTLKWIEGAAYARFEFRNINDRNQIEKGTQPTNYERYTENRELLKILSLPSSIPLLTNYNYSIFTDNIIYKTAETESGFYIKDYPIYKDRFIIESSTAGNINKEFIVYNNNLIDNSGILNFTFYDPYKYRGKEINILTIGDSFGDIGTFIEAIKNKMNDYGVNINLLGTHNKIETRKSESLSGGKLKYFILTPSGDGAVITATNISENSDIPQSTYGSPQYQDANGIKWNVIGNKRMNDGSHRLRLGRWNPNGTWGQAIPPTGELIKVESKGDGLEKISYKDGESCPYNPFWNPHTNELDFNYYISKWKFNTPDIILLQFTWNDLPSYANKQQCEEFSKNLKNVIDIIHSQLPVCKIIFSIEPAGAILSNKGTYFIDGSHYTRLQLNDVLQEKFGGTSYPFFYIAPSYAFVNRMSSFNTTIETPNSNYPSDQIEYVSDGVHCNTYGMNQIADCIIPYILSSVD